MTKKVAIILLLLLLNLYSVFSKENTNKFVIAVYPFENITQNTEHDWLCTGIMSTMITDLSNLNEWIVVDRNSLEKAIMELKFSLSGLSEGDVSLKVGNFLTANMYITGDFQIVGENILINARVVDVETNRVINATRAVGNYLTEIFDIQSAIVLNLINDVNEYNSIKNMPSVKLNDETKASINYKLLNDCRIFEIYSKAEDFFYKADYYNARNFLKDILIENPDNYPALVLLCKLEIETANYQEALQTITWAFHVSNIEDTHRTQVISTCLYYMGIIYEMQGIYNEALKYHFEALKMRKELYGSEHPDVANSINSIGIIYDYQEEYDLALEYYSNALEIRLQLFGSNHTYVADSFNNIGIIYDFLGDYENALKFHTYALNIYLDSYGENHPYTAGSYLNIGAVYNEMGLYDEASRYLLYSKNIFEAVYGIKHPDTADAYFTIGSIAENQKDYKKALSFYEIAFDIQRDIFGNEHPETIDSYDSMNKVRSYLTATKKAVTSEPDKSSIEVSLGFISYQYRSICCTGARSSSDYSYEFTQYSDGFIDLLSISICYMYDLFDFFALGTFGTIAFGSSEYKVANITYTPESTFPVDFTPPSSYCSMSVIPLFLQLGIKILVGKNHTGLAFSSEIGVFGNSIPGNSLGIYPNVKIGIHYKKFFVSFSPPFLLKTIGAESYSNYKGYLIQIGYSFRF